MKLKVISDGTNIGTHVVNENGDKLQCIQSIDYEIDAEKRITYATIKIAMPAAEITALSAIQHHVYSEDDQDFHIVHPIEDKTVNIVSNGEISGTFISGTNGIPIGWCQKIHWHIDVADEKPKTVVDLIGLAD